MRPFSGPPCFGRINEILKLELEELIDPLTPRPALCDRSISAALEICTNTREGLHKITSRASSRLSSSRGHLPVLEDYHGSTTNPIGMRKFRELPFRRPATGLQAA